MAPHHLRILLDYDTYSQLSRQSWSLLKQELTASAKQYINDRRYKLTQPLALTLNYDPIALSSVVRADFDENASAGIRTSNDKSASYLYRLKSVEGSAILSFDLKDLKPGGGPISIGRSADNALILDDKSVSKFHAVLATDSDGRIILADCGSANGTFINRQLVKNRAEISPGDLLGFGDLELRLEKTE